MELLALIGVVMLGSFWILAIADFLRSRPCPYCVKRVHRDATRCPYCTSAIEPPPLTGVDDEIAARREADELARHAAPPPVPPAPPAARPASPPPRRTTAGGVDLGIDLDRPK